MEVKSGVKPVLLSGEQISAIIQLQAEYKAQSSLGISPSIHEVARGLIRQALELSKVKA